MNDLCRKRRRRQKYTVYDQALEAEEMKKPSEIGKRDDRYNV